ncbi:hypothetical protein GBF38_012645 [Nibea albiflora]|uniref:Uncharacterized protein n=1 Tax=Nibea albiflora TaxID=240163 RepID=A0ACB7EYR7_NIBAL|nr:hypothetical protein GBF38_012645 [Nibea albiflora]
MYANTLNSVEGSRMRSLFSRCLQWASLRHNASLPPQSGVRDNVGNPAEIPDMSRTPPPRSRDAVVTCAVISASEDGYFVSTKIFNLDF